MSTEARVRIHAHRLMREVGDSDHIVRVEEARSEISRIREKERSVWKYRVLVHIGVFLVSFIFTTGVLVLGVLLWVQPNSFLAILVVGICSSLVYVVSFASVRMVILHGLLLEYPNKEDDPGLSHHVSKSIAYGFIALVVAIILAGTLVTIASANVF